MKSMNKRRILNIILWVLMVLLWGYQIITYIKRENEHKEQLAAASANAVRYINEKYGIEPEIMEDLDNKYYTRYNSYFNDEMFFRMKAGGKEFYVLADTQEGSSNCADDYQHEEISAAITDEIAKTLPDGCLIDFWFGSTRGGAIWHCFMDKYYNGENIDEVFENAKGTIEMVFADTDFSEKGIPAKLEQWNMAYKFTSFDTRERVEQFAKNTEIDEITYEIYAPYITDCIESPAKDGSKSGISYALKSYDDFKYCYFPTKVNKYEDSSDNVTVTEVEQSKFSYAFEYHDEEYCISKPLSKVYGFDCLYGDVCIYYPVEKFNDMNIENIGAAWFCRTGQYNNRDIARAEICGEYAVFILPFNNQEFMLVDNTGQEEYIPEWKKDENG